MFEEGDDVILECEVQQEEWFGTIESITSDAVINMFGDCFLITNRFLSDSYTLDTVESESSCVCGVRSVLTLLYKTEHNRESVL